MAVDTARISAATHRYYRAVILPILAKYQGFESTDECHRHAKAGFFGIHMDDPNLPSMGQMSQEESSRYLDWVLRQAAEMSLVLPDPNTERSPSRFSRTPSGAVPGAKK